MTSSEDGFFYLTEVWSYDILSSIANWISHIKLGLFFWLKRCLKNLDRLNQHEIAL